MRYAALEGLTVMDPETMQKTPADGETIGEVMFRGNIVMKGYLKNPKATDEAFAGGWFHSGDLGVMHPDGYIQLKDRSKDIIISGGENISSIEVEDALYKHPAVASCGVVARPDEKWGEVPVAYVELKPGKTATEAEIIDALPHAAGALQVPEGGRLRGNPEDLDRQDPEIQAAGDGPRRKVPAFVPSAIQKRLTFFRDSVNHLLSFTGVYCAPSSDLDSYRVVGATPFDASLLTPESRLSAALFLCADLQARSPRCVNLLLNMRLPTSAGGAFSITPVV